MIWGFVSSPFTFSSDNEAILQGGIASKQLYVQTDGIRIQHKEEREAMDFD